MRRIEEGSYILIVHEDRRYLKRVKRGELFSGRAGKLLYDDIIGKNFGFRHGEYLILEPSLEDLIMHGIKRETQIVYPKDSFYICLKLDLKNGSKLLEVGCGSGALTLVFSRVCGPDGRVVSLEKEERHYRNAKKNIDTFCELKNVDLVLGDLSQCKEDNFDASFIDVREPWLCMEEVWRLLRPCGIVGTIVPTANQISETLKSLQEGFADVEVVELLLRRYKTIPERVRPFDRMVAHTGYLIFAKKITR